MTQHLVQAQTDEDRRIMRRLFSVVGGFIVATAVMAIAVAVFFA